MIDFYAESAFMQIQKSTLTQYFLLNCVFFFSSSVSISWGFSRATRGAWHVRIRGTGHVTSLDYTCTTLASTCCASGPTWTVATQTGCCSPSAPTEMVSVHTGSSFQMQVGVTWPRLVSPQTIKNTPRATGDHVTPKVKEALPLWRKSNWTCAQVCMKRAKAQLTGAECWKAFCLQRKSPNSRKKLDNLFFSSSVFHSLFWLNLRFLTFFPRFWFLLFSLFHRIGKHISNSINILYKFIFISCLTAPPGGALARLDLIGCRSPLRQHFLLKQDFLFAAV